MGRKQIFAWTFAIGGSGHWLNAGRINLAAAQSVVGNACKTILNQAASLAFKSLSAHSSVRYKGE
jgi:hypothetical protein